MKNWLIAVLVVLVLAVLGVLSYFYLWPNYLQKYFASPPEPVATETKTATVSDPGVTWVTPKKLDDLKLILLMADNLDSSISETPAYYKIADLESGGELILAIIQPDGPSLPEFLRFKKDTDGKYTYLVNNSAVKEMDIFSKFLESSIVEDYTTTYQSITPPNYLTSAGTTFKIGYNVGLFSELESIPTKIATTEYGNLYSSRAEVDAKDISGINYKLKLADGTYVNYTIKFPFLTDDDIALITWADGTKNTAKFTAEGYVSCGMVATDNVILDTTKIASRLKETGQTQIGDKIYTVEATDPVMVKAYENYQIGRTENVLTIEQFASQNAIFVWKSATGDYVVFTNRDFGGLAECGKPVIYLYPEVPTKVSVKIAARITKSEPLYQNGWEVLAQPNGKLIVNDQLYPYLFWEGQGQSYPAIKEGVVVKKGEIAATLKTQLGQLGLNTKESTDFLEFWLPKMPETPYVRLTWFGTSQMDKLAPLSVSPKPDTIIRIFLDFEGLVEPTNLKAQNLTGAPRQGFTLVEWGGLLRGGN